MNNKIFISNDLFLNDSYVNLIKETDKRLNYIILYLYCNTDKIGYSNFSLADMIKTSGYVVSSVKGKSVCKFKDSLLILEKHGIIKDVSTEIHKATPRNFVNCKLNNNIISDKYTENSFSLDMSVFTSIINNKNIKENKVILLHTYCYLMFLINNNKMLYNNNLKDKISFPNRDCIIEVLNIKSQLFNNILKKLNELNLIYYGNIGYVSKNYRVRKSNNVYADNEDDLDLFIENERYLYIKDGYEIVDEKEKKEIDYLDNVSGVYFILNKSNNLIKIGCTNNIQKRFKQIKGQFRHLGLDDNIELVNYIDTSDYKNVEKELHEKYSDNRVINEWFNITVGEAMTNK